MAVLLETFDTGQVKYTPSKVFMPGDTLEQPCDVILVVEGDKQFKAHRQVLSEASRFFEKLLNSDMKESKEGTVRLEMFSESVMSVTLEFIYTGHVQISTEDNARDLIAIADYLFLQNLKTLGEKVLIQWLSVSNCFSNYHFSEKYHCEELFFKAQTFMLANFSVVYSANPAEVLNMSSRDIEVLISSDKINVSAEEEVFNIILSRINHDRSKREQYFADLFRHVRLVYVSRDFLCSDVVTNDLVRDKEGCLDLVEDAMKLIELQDFNSFPVKPRNSLESSVMVIKKDGEIFFYFPLEDKWYHLKQSCRLNYSRLPISDPIGFVSFRGKLYEINDMSINYLRLVRYEPLLNHPILLPYTGKKDRHLEKAFVTKQDELYALESEPCNDHGLFRNHDFFPAVQDIPSITGCSKETHAFFITKYKHESNSWQDVSSFDHLGRCHSCIVATDNFIYFIGGVEFENGLARNVRTDVDRYDLRKDQWSKVADVHERYLYYWGAAVNKSIFIIGEKEAGYPSSQSYQCEVYDEANNEWQVIANPSSDGKVQTLVAVDDKLYAVMQMRRDIIVKCYDPVQNKWNLKTEMTLSDGKLWRGRMFSCSMRIYKDYRALLVDHQLERFVPLITPRRLSSPLGSDSFSDSRARPTVTSSTCTGKCKCFIV